MSLRSLGVIPRVRVQNTRPYKDNGWSRYEPHHGDALLYYTTLAAADPDVKKAIVTLRPGEQIQIFEGV